MTTYVATALAMTLTPTEISTVAGALPGGADAVGLLTAAVAAMTEAANTVNILHGLMPSGTNKTALGTALTMLTT
jgi:hypothetical protein